MDILRLLRTMRYMDSKQISAQIKYRVRKTFGKPINLQKFKASEFPGLVDLPETTFPAPPTGANTTEQLLEGNFTFLNSTERLGWPPDWSREEPAALWQYHLHCFDWLWLLDFNAAKEVCFHWVQYQYEKPIPVAWEPYPVSLRLMNWLALFLGKFREETEKDTDFCDSLWHIVSIHAAWLLDHLEHHLRGNHLLENAGALILAGSFFKGSEAEKWFQTGHTILQEEIPEQILSDGTHFERSPMYQCRIMYLFQLLKQTQRPELQRLIGSTLEKMSVSLSNLTHPDGRIALLNDSAFGIYHKPETLLAKTQRKEGSWALPDAGYFGFYGKDGTYIVCDAGEIGPDYLPGHAHGDMFSFEMSFKGQRVIVDSGVYDYEDSEMRRYCRGTRAHNTVEIEGQDQCEFWEAFRVARRGYPHGVQWDPFGFRLSAWHDGYMRLPGKPKHHRTFNYRHSAIVEVQDRITAERKVQAVSRLHFHPECTVSIVDDMQAEVQCLTGTLGIIFSGNGNLELEQSYYCPEFGLKQENKSLAFHFSGSQPEVGFRIAPKQQKTEASENQK